MSMFAKKKPEMNRILLQNHVEFLFSPSGFAYSVPTRLQTGEVLIYLYLLVTKQYVYVHADIIETLLYVNIGTFQCVNNLPGIVPWTTILEVRAH